MNASDIKRYFANFISNNNFADGFASLFFDKRYDFIVFLVANDSSGLEYIATRVENNLYCSNKTAMEFLIENRRDLIDGLARLIKEYPPGWMED